MEQHQRQKEQELRQLQEIMQLLELEHELRQCAGDSDRAIVDGSEVHDVAIDLELINNSVSGSEAASGFMGIMVWQSDVWTNFWIDYQTDGLYGMHSKNRFDFSTLTLKAEETPRWSLFPTSSLGFLVRISTSSKNWLLGLFFHFVSLYEHRYESRAVQNSSLRQTKTSAKLSKLFFITT